MAHHPVLFSLFFVAVLSSSALMTVAMPVADVADVEAPGEASASPDKVDAPEEALGNDIDVVDEPSGEVSPTADDDVDVASDEVSPTVDEVDEDDETLDEVSPTVDEDEEDDENKVEEESEEVVDDPVEEELDEVLVAGANVKISCENPHDLESDQTWDSLLFAQDHDRDHYHLVFHGTRQMNDHDDEWLAEKSQDGRHTKYTLVGVKVANAGDYVCNEPKQEMKNKRVAVVGKSAVCGTSADYCFCRLDYKGDADVTLEVTQDGEMIQVERIEESTVLIATFPHGGEFQCAVKGLGVETVEGCSFEPPVMESRMDFEVEEVVETGASNATFLEDGNVTELVEGEVEKVIVNLNESVVTGEDNIVEIVEIVDIVGENVTETVEAVVIEDEAENEVAPTAPVEIEDNVENDVEPTSEEAVIPPNEDDDDDDDESPQNDEVTMSDEGEEESIEEPDGDFDDDDDDYDDGPISFDDRK